VSGVHRHLSPHLSEAEFISTRHADLWEEQVEAWGSNLLAQGNAARFAVSVFERLREMVGPLYVRSGYRCPRLNTAVGGRPNSRHILGLAADVVPAEVSLTEAMEVAIRAFHAGAFLDCDEILLEMGWIHIQGAPVGREARRIALATNDGIKFAPYARSHA
jgi:zinc D-Ala-D-Ala carboxypeptidase